MIKNLNIHDSISIKGFLEYNELNDFKFIDVSSINFIVYQFEEYLYPFIQ